MSPMNADRRELTAAHMAVREMKTILTLIKADTSKVEIVGRIAGAINATEALIHAHILAPEDVRPDDLVAHLVNQRREGIS